MILLAGATGRLGTVVVDRLVTAGQPVRALTRDVSRAAHLAGPLVEIVRGDVRDPGTLWSAVKGVRTVVSAVQGFAGQGHVTPTSVDRDGNANLIAATAAAGADFILVSGVGATPDHPMELFRMKAAAESCLRASDVRWTIVRATAFLELYLDLLRSSAGASGRPLVFGRGDNPINFVPVADVATTVSAAVLDSDRDGRFHELRGTTNYTLNQLALKVQAETGTARKGPRHVPRAALRAIASVSVINASLARKAAAALIMDTIDMTAGVTTTVNQVR